MGNTTLLFPRRKRLSLGDWLVKAGIESCWCYVAGRRQRSDGLKHRTEAILAGLQSGWLTVIGAELRASHAAKSRRTGKPYEVWWVQCRCRCGRIHWSSYGNFKAGLKSCGKCGYQKGSRAVNWQGCGAIPLTFFSACRVNADARGHCFSLSIEDLDVLFRAQGGACALSGMELSFGGCVPDCRKASLDRIDPLVGYERGNVQFVSKLINLAKHTMTQEVFVALCNAVAVHSGGL